MSEHDAAINLEFSRCKVTVGRGCQLWEATDGVVTAYVHGPCETIWSRARQEDDVWLWATAARSNRLHRQEGRAESRQDAILQAAEAARYLHQATIQPE